MLSAWNTASRSSFMPELPEVETIARGLDRRVKGDVIESVWLGSKPEPLKSPAAEIVATLESKKILGVRRMGKHIVFDLERKGRAGALFRQGEQISRCDGSMDRASRHDRPHAGLRRERRSLQTHPRHRQTGFRTGIAIR